jgi:hypothetical protein
MINEQLLGYLFDDRPHILTAFISRWIETSRPFKAFATTYRNKIRKKIRITQNDSAIQDLAVELETAYRLLQQKRFTVVYEPYGSQKTRGPDFAVTFKSISFNVEVTRISPDETEGTPQEAALRLMDTVCDKLGQMRPGMINVLAVVMDGRLFSALEIDQAMAQLKGRAEQKDAALFGRYGYVKPADFFKQYLRLSAILIRPTSQPQEKPVIILWLNNQTKHPLPRPVQNILQRGWGNWLIG